MGLSGRVVGMDFDFLPLNYQSLPLRDFPAVYCLRNSKAGRIYIGGSERVRKRLYQHFAEMRGGYHANKPIREAVERDGFDCWQWAIVERCDDGGLEGRETEWILKTGCCDSSVGYNRQAHATNPDERVRIITREWWAQRAPMVIFVSPDGSEKREVVSRVDFANEIGCDKKEVYSAISGRIPHVYGWAPESAPRHTVFDPSGRSYSYVSRKLFRDLTKCPANLCRIERQPGYQSKGWSGTLENCLINRPLPPPKPKRIKQKATEKKPLNLLSPEGKVVEFESRGAARRVIGGDKSMFFKMLKQKSNGTHIVRSYRGWRPVPE